jgi:hypothetical protein
MNPQPHAVWCSGTRRATGERQARALRAKELAEERQARVAEVERA